MKLVYPFLVFIFFFTMTNHAQVSITPDNPNIHYWGRIDFSNAMAPSFEFPGITIKAQFTGTSISMALHDYASQTVSTTNYYYKIIDGGTPEKFQALAGHNTYVLASGLSEGSHTVEIIKLTESNVGKSSFLGFSLDDGAELQPMSSPSNGGIEFIGNSITCGYGNEISFMDPNTNPNPGFHSINENNYNAWGYQTARLLDMSYRAISYSGRGLYRNNTGSEQGTLPKIYNRIFPDDSNSPTWHHQTNPPHIIVINLGTNDFAPDPANPLDETAYKTTYISFVETLKSLHPEASIICATGVMMSDYWPVDANHWTRITSYVQEVVNTLTDKGYSNIYFFQMAPQSAPYGEDWHPTTATHTRMATELSNFIESEKVLTVKDLTPLSKPIALLYPNPVNLEINLDDNTNNDTWYIFSTTGQELLQGTTQKINVSGLAPGTYLLRYKESTQQFIKH